MKRWFMSLLLLCLIVLLYPTISFIGVKSDVVKLLVILCAAIPYVAAQSNRIKNVDWRLRAMLAATSLSIAASLVCYGLGLGLDPSTFFGAIFASWIGALAFFAFVGFAVAVVSIARPEEGTFDSRARILFKGERGRHIEYAINCIKQFEHYAESSEKKFIIEEFNAQESKFRIVIDDDTKIKSYIDDIPCIYNSRFELEDVTAAPSGSNDRNILRIFRIDGRAEATNVIFTDKIKKEFPVQIEPYSTCNITHTFSLWFNKATEEFAVILPRYTNTVTIKFDNRTSNKVKIAIQGMINDTITLDAGQPRSLSPLSYLEPDKPVLTFKLDL